VEAGFRPQRRAANIFQFMIEERLPCAGCHRDDSREVLQPPAHFRNKPVAFPMMRSSMRVGSSLGIVHLLNFLGTMA
jgi:hypothetical protein